MLKVGTHYKDINVADEMLNGSIRSFYQQIITLRKTEPVIAEGDYEPWMPDHNQVYAYIRGLNDTQLLVLNNFSNEATKISIPECFVRGEVLISNYNDVTVAGVQRLEPYQTLAIISRKV